MVSCSDAANSYGCTYSDYDTIIFLQPYRWMTKMSLSVTLSDLQVVISAIEMSIIVSISKKYSMSLYQTQN